MRLNPKEDDVIEALGYLSARYAAQQTKIAQHHVHQIDAHGVGDIKICRFNKVTFLFAHYADLYP